MRASPPWLRKPAVTKTSLEPAVCMETGLSYMQAALSCGQAVHRGSAGPMLCSEPPCYAASGVSTQARSSPVSCVSRVSACMHAQSCVTLCDPVDYSPPGSSLHGILQARIPVWVAISPSKGSCQPSFRSKQLWREKLPCPPPTPPNTPTVGLWRLLWVTAEVTGNIRARPQVGFFGLVKGNDAVPGKKPFRLHQEGTGLCGPQWAQTYHKNWPGSRKCSQSGILIEPAGEHPVCAKGRLPAPPWGLGQQGCSEDGGSAATERSLGGLGLITSDHAGLGMAQDVGQTATCSTVGPLGPSPIVSAKTLPSLDSLGVEEDHGGGRLGGEADLLFTSHKISFSGGAAKRMYSRMVSMPYCSTTSSGSTPLCLDLLIFSQLTSSFSLVFA